MRKITIFIIAVLLILLAVFVFSKKSEPNGAGMPTEEMDSNSVVQPEKIITYNNDGFSPKSLEINKGDIVNFINNSPNPFWPAASFHPTHANYPVGGGCIGSAFDACKDIAPGGSWQFTFDIEGTYGYHDHLKASNFGTIVVK